MNGLKVFFCFKDIITAAARPLEHTGTVPMVAVALIARLECIALVSHTYTQLFLVDIIIN